MVFQKNEAIRGSGYWLIIFGLVFYFQNKFGFKFLWYFPIRFKDGDFLLIEGFKKNKTKTDLRSGYLVCVGKFSSIYGMDSASLEGFAYHINYSWYFLAVVWFPSSTTQLLLQPWVHEPIWNVQSWWCAPKKQSDFFLSKKNKKQNKWNKNQN